jgi:hypothetical protein
MSDSVLVAIVMATASVIAAWISSRPSEQTEKKIVGPLSRRIYALGYVQHVQWTGIKDMHHMQWQWIR